MFFSLKIPNYYLFKLNESCIDFKYYDIAKYDLVREDPTNIKDF